ncbi:MAG TPA: DUF3105 domain-containing protein [Polyangiaceae bacterium]|nr:DUF3105 domain-containing protein [Polyangiaceae bacterium]
MSRRAQRPGPFRRLLPLALALLALPPGCGDDDGGGGGACAAGQIASCACADGAPGERACRADGAGYEACACRAPEPGCAAPVEASHPIEGARHVPTCSARVAYATNPPSSGDHYPQWAAFGSYREAVPAEFLVHNLEHGAVVIAHNCPGACPPADAACPGRCAAAVAEAEALAAAYGPDPRCAAPVRNRFVVTPMPTLDVPFAAAAWGHTLRAGCFDRAAFLRFAEAHYARGPEDVCADGIDPFAAGPPCPGLAPLPPRAPGGLASRVETADCVALTPARPGRPPGRGGRGGKPIGSAGGPGTPLAYPKPALGRRPKPRSPGARRARTRPEEAGPRAPGAPAPGPEEESAGRVGAVAILRKRLGRRLTQGAGATFSGTHGPPRRLGRFGPTRGARARPAGPPRPDYKQRRRYPNQMLQRDLERIARQLSQGVIGTLREASVEELAELFPAVGRLLRQAERGAAAAERDRGRERKRERDRRPAPPPARPSSVKRREAPAPKPALAGPLGSTYAASVEHALGQSPGGLRSEEIQARVMVGTRELRTILNALVGSGRVVRRGQARGTRYALAGDSFRDRAPAGPASADAEPAVDIELANALRARLADSAAPMTLAELEAASGRPRAELRPALDHLIKLNLATREGHGPASRYLLAPQGSPVVRRSADAGPPRVVRRPPKAKAWQPTLNLDAPGPNAHGDGPGEPSSPAAEG